MAVGASAPQRADDIPGQAGLLAAGDNVEVYSNSNQVWCQGVVKSVDNNEGNVLVFFRLPQAAANDFLEKTLPWNSKDLRKVAVLQEPPKRPAEQPAQVATPQVKQAPLAAGPLKPLLRAVSVLDLCGGDVLLPSDPPRLSKEEQQSWVPSMLRDRLRRGASDDTQRGRAAGAFMLDPRKAAAMQWSGGDSPSAAGSRDAAGPSPSFARLTETLSIGVGLMSRWAADEKDKPQLSCIAGALDLCLRLTRSVPRPPFYEHKTWTSTAIASDLISRVKGEVMGATDADQRFCAFLQELLRELRNMPPGGLMMLPVAWLRSYVSKTDPDMADDGGHCALMVVLRDHRKPDQFAVAVINTGEGLQYHPVRASNMPPHPGQPLRQTPLILLGVPAAKIWSSAFWYMLYKQVILPSPNNGPELFYAVMLPFLNQQPLSSNFGKEPKGWTASLPVPVSGDHSYAHCMERAVFFCLTVAGFSAAEAAWSSVRLRQTLVTSIGEALAAPGFRAQSLGERALVQLATTSLARAASDHAATFGESTKVAAIRELVDRTEARAEDMMRLDQSAQSLLPPQCPMFSAETPLETSFPELERLLPQDVEHLKGAVDPPRILIPVLTSKMPLSIDDPFGAAACCRLTATLLTLMSNQQDQITHAAPARFALVAHLMTRLLPVPLPIDHPEKQTKCFWMQDMRSETKADLMRYLYLIARHFTAVSFTLQDNRETDAARILVIGALVAVMDALLRRPLAFLSEEDSLLEASEVTLHYSGQADGPVLPFGLDPGVFRKVSESLLLPAPEYAALRTLVLDYFLSVRRAIDDDHVIFQFDQGGACSEGDRRLVEQIGLSLGVEAAKREAHLLITGERPDILELSLELAWFRDVVFLWKTLLHPSGGNVEKKKWRARDSILHWSWKGDRYSVFGFGTDLSAHWNQTPAGGVGGQIMGFFDRIKGTFDQAVGIHRRQQCLASGADPSELAGSEVHTEHDILSLEHLPTFNGSLTAAESELLLTYLTAPYLRVPLLLGFFTDRDRISLLKEPELQQVLDAALFEGGAWQSQDEGRQGAPPTIPAADRTHLGTPTGVLFNELIKSPEVVLKSLLSMLQVVVEKDTGMPGAANEAVILYVVRLAVRVESYLTFAIEHAAAQSRVSRIGAYWEALVRGLPTAADTDLQRRLQDMHAPLREMLQGSVFKMLFCWANAAMRKRDKYIHAACRAHAHLALLFKNVHFQALTEQDVAVFLSAEVFLNMNHRWFRGSGQAKHAEKAEEVDWLGVSEFELFDSFEAKRSQITRWLREAAASRDPVLQAVERVATFKGTIVALFPGEADVEVSWEELPRQPGNFVPRAELPGDDWRQARQGEEYQPWLLRVTQGPLEGHGQISTNLGKYVAGGGGLELLPEWALESPDLLAAFPRATEVYCSNKEVCANRVWKELVGQHHDVQRWVPDDRGPQADDHTAKWMSMFGSKYDAERLTVEQRWVADILEPVRTRISGFAAFELRIKGEIPDGQDAVVTLVTDVVTKGKEKGTLPLHQLKEVIVRRTPPVVEVYEIVEYGRQFYKTMVFTSDRRWSYHAPAGQEHVLQCPITNIWTLGSGRIDALVPPAVSTVVHRTISEKFGRQMFIPKAYLRGLIPDALVDRYKFWRFKGVIVGDETIKADMPTRLYIFLIKDGASHVAARVERHALQAPDTEADLKKPIATWEENPSKSVELLVNLRAGEHAAIGSLCARLEDLSQVLAWTRRGEEHTGSIHRIEFPRLLLSFAEDTGQLLCDQHNGFWLMQRVCPEELQSVLAQFGGGTVLLEDHSGNIMILLSSVAEPIRPTSASHTSLECFLPCQTIFRRGRPEWIANLSSGSRHYHYPVHMSGAFVFTPTLSAGLYLLLCRFLTWHFAEVVSMASTVSEPISAEEKQLWDSMQVLVTDGHADAIASRLHLSLAALPNGDSMKMPWEVGAQMMEYVRKRALVSANCALSLQQESYILQLPELQKMANEGSPELWSRRGVVDPLLQRAPANTEVGVYLGPFVDDSGFDRVVDQSFLEEAGFLDKMSASMHGVAYQRPKKTKMNGLDAVVFLNQRFDEDAAVQLESQSPLLYEFFTRTILAQVVPDDDPGVMAELLLRVMFANGQQSTELSILRVLANNPQLCREMPLWGSEEVRSSYGLKELQFERTSVSKLMTMASERLRTKARQGALRFPPNFPPTPAVDKYAKLGDARSWCYFAPPLTSDVLCDRRDIRSDGHPEFGDRPLEAIAQKYVVADESNGGGPNRSGLKGVAAGIKDLQSLDSGVARSYTSQRSLERIMDEVRLAQNEKSAKVTLRMQSWVATEAADIFRALVSQKQADVANMREALARIVEVANKGDDLRKLRQRCGQAPTLSLSSLVAALSSRDPEAKQALMAANPSLTADLIDSLYAMIALMLFHTVRVGQVSRAQSALRALMTELRTGAGISGGPAEQLSMRLKAQATAEQLNATRRFAKLSGNSLMFDPRLLTFEFLFDIMLRGEQVKLLIAFMQSALNGKGQSLCHQMIMGAGKTTVIAPLLALLLADGRRLVCACMPAALVDMSRSIMIERFSSPVLPKPVLTVHFARDSPATPAFRDRLYAAAANKAVVVSAPTQLKSIVLKQVELLTALHASQRRQGQQQPKQAAEFMQLPSWLVGKAARRPPFSEDLSAEEEASKATEARVCGDVLQLLHGGVMLMDEVDLLLDPLKSELNWPMGRKMPLDMTEPLKGDSESDARNNRGFRYKLPFHILDGVFVAMGYKMTMPYEDRTDACDALEHLRKSVEGGKKQCKLQTIPHLVLLCKKFYTGALKPFLADWTAVFLEPYTSGVFSAAEVKDILRHGKATQPTTADRMRRADGRTLKALNLAVDWLHVYMPHVLSKVHRVSFGLLLGEDLQKAEKNPRTPIARTKLAIPFVGKDRPSEQSEFSQPDVAIGLTIVAYRLQGLRPSDVLALLRNLKTEMRAENTRRYHRRAACQAYVGMVIAGGGTVRGFTEDGRWLADLTDEDRRSRGRKSPTASPSLRGGLSSAASAASPDGGSPAAEAQRQQEQADSTFAVGSAVEVFSNSHECWCSGSVQAVDEEGWITVAFQMPDGDVKTKELPPGSQQLRRSREAAIAATPQVGQQVQIWSNSHQVWCEGEVLAVDADGVTVGFCYPGENETPLQKTLPIGDEALRILDAGPAAVGSSGVPRLGQRVQIFSNSHQVWCDGQVLAVAADGVTVGFCYPGESEPLQKTLPIGDEALRLLDTGPADEPDADWATGASPRGNMADLAELQQSSALWPLELLDIRDPEQMLAVSNVLGECAAATRYLLEQSVFLPGSGAIDCNLSQLTASGQELAGSQLFGFCLGFSGTPNDLLPRSMGHCQYAEGDDGRILSVLSDANIATVRQLGGWSPEGIIDDVAAARNSAGTGPRYHAFIDTGALITGLSNKQVAERLLRKGGLQGLEGVVFLNEADERMVLLRDGFKVLELAQCGLSPAQRFTFYDHYHTTGMDIKQPLSCTACLTLSKDMTFRDYAQGAYRMRGIGKGQLIEVLAIPEVVSLINVDLNIQDPSVWNDSTPKQVIDVITWLTLNGLKKETHKHSLLCEQNMKNLWLEAAASMVQSVTSQGQQQEDLRQLLEQPRMTMALAMLRNRTDFGISNRPPGEKEDSQYDILSLELQKKLSTGGSGGSESAVSLWPSAQAQEEAKAAGAEILQQLRHDSSQPDAVNEDTDKLALNGEVVQQQQQEQESEQEKEKEQENEQEEEMENEQEKEHIVEAPAPKQWVRDDEDLKPWHLGGLTKPLAQANLPFYALSDFSVNKGVAQSSTTPLKSLPEYVMVTDNYFKRAWRLSGQHRIKNVICFLEWVPSAQDLAPLQNVAQLSPQQQTRLHQVFAMFDADQSGRIEGKELQLFFAALDLEEEGEQIVASAAGHALSLEEIEASLCSQTFYKLQQGRYYIAMSLEEAEHLRASMHLLNGQNWPELTGLALRCIGNKESSLDMSLIDETGPVTSTAELGYQLEAAEQVLRFFNCAADFQSRDVSILLRTLQPTLVADRLPWWIDVRSCRRRQQKPWDQLSFSRVFVEADEYDHLTIKAVLSRFRWALAALRLSPGEAFSQIDVDGNSVLSYAEFVQGMEWLGLQRVAAAAGLTATQVQMVFDFIDSEHNGSISRDEFTAAMELQDFDWASVPSAVKPGDDAAPSPLDRARALEQERRPAVQALTAADCRWRPSGRYKLKWQPHSYFQQVWSTTGTLADKPLAILAPTALDNTAFTKVRQRICLGHLASADTSGKASALMLEVTDSEQDGMFKAGRRESLNLFVDTFFPHPVAFRQVSMLRPAQATSAQSLCFWRPIPPSETFAAVGVLATRGSTQPPLSSVRCVPRPWAAPLQDDNIAALWSDQGIEGTPSELWTRTGHGGQGSAALFDVSTGDAVRQGRPPEGGMLAMPDSGQAKKWYGEMPQQVSL
eukprot:TRINITY_DN23026_c0_g1_i2.p1 TRINITY_DN23026_c0_g1~~TRINITY_DN23026_c0_g1_i2.p1  ORF type:complete len:4431 (+),score=980.35 TRINITY_DN23026_c0_g1_i2:153-13445(+)